MCDKYDFRLFLISLIAKNIKDNLVFFMSFNSCFNLNYIRYNNIINKEIKRKNER